MSDVGEKLDDGSGLLTKLAARMPSLDISIDDLALYQSDIYYTSPHPPLARLIPKTVAEVRDLVMAARALSVSLSTRGAGLSYSAGYIPSNNHTLIVDMTAMNRILDINQQDMYVTLEPGVTWSALREALRPLGLTTPFWGTFSGLHATIGASLSQGAKFYGSASRGTSAESVLGLTLVTGAGEVLITGSAASTETAASPFFRNYGPDLTGLFLGDCGAYGIKVAITLQLLPAARNTEVCSYSFDDPVAQLRAMGQIGAEMLASECLGMDPFSARSRMESEGLVSDLRTLGSVISGSASIVSGLADAARIALQGRRFARNIGYLMNCIVEGRDAQDARSRIRRVQRIAADAGGRAIPASIPRVMRTIPFPRMNGLLTPSSKRMNWLHTVVPNSQGGNCFEVTEAAFARHADAMKIHGIDRGYLLSTHGPSGVGIETLIRWPDAPYPIHTHYMSEAERAKLRKREADPQASQAVAALSQDIIAAWQKLGGVHMQIGRKYPYLQTRLPETAGLLRELKRVLDPDGIINPGNLFGNAH